MNILLKSRENLYNSKAYNMVCKIFKFRKNMGETIFGEIPKSTPQNLDI